MTETKADGPSARGSGRRSNFSISGNETSTTGWCCSRTCWIISGTRCRVCGPKIISTYGARLRMASPSWLATQPPTPMIKSARLSFQRFQRPSWEKTFSWAFSRIEQVLSSRTSASSGVAVRDNPWVSRSRSEILSESYSFIWQPNVLI